LDMSLTSPMTLRSSREVIVESIQHLSTRSFDHWSTLLPCLPLQDDLLTCSWLIRTIQINTFVSHAINGLPMDSYFDVGPGSFFVE
jgi:hypothetical protein